jgi:hypothetical protein
MKNNIPTLALIFLLLAVSAHAQEGRIEARIHRLEADQVAYLLRGDVNRMKQQWASDFTVNNPFNVIQDAASGPIQTRALEYSKFERNIEKILVHGTVVIVMGNELVVPKTAPKGSSHDTSEPITRRFTNIWMRKEDRWLMIARHANVICSNLDKR